VTTQSLFLAAALSLTLLAGPAAAAASAGAKNMCAKADALQAAAK
jgi:hypothetical protein